MVFQTLSSLAWVAVIVLQALIHFVIGPLYLYKETIQNEGDDNGDQPNLARGEQTLQVDDDGTMTMITDDTESSNNGLLLKNSIDNLNKAGDDQDEDDHSTKADQSKSKKSVQGSETADDSKTTTADSGSEESEGTVPSEMETPELDPDERDSVEDGVQETQLQLNARTQPPPPSPSRLSNTCTAARSSLGDLDPESTSKNCSSSQGNDSASFSGEGQEQQPDYSYQDHGPCSKHYHDCIYDDEDDEEWRYQLIKDYYASNNNSTLLLLQSISISDDAPDCDYEYEYGSSGHGYGNASNPTSTANITEDEDPALFPVGTINTLSEKLNQQRALAKIQQQKKHKNNGGSGGRSVPFDHSSSTIPVIASY